MKELTPPIHERDTDELIIMAHGTTSDWQQYAIDQAKEELRRRNVSMEYQLRVMQEINAFVAKEMAELLEWKRTASYNTFDKIRMVIFLYKTILTDWTLKKDGYETMHKQRLRLIWIGCMLYFLLFMWILIYMNMKSWAH